MIHPARILSFSELQRGLKEAIEKKLVYEKIDGSIALYCYTKECVYNKAWNDIAILARGLVIDLKNQKVIATPFPKFWNLGEDGRTFPDLPFEAFEKLDGSLIIAFHHDGAWRCATKGSFNSQQAQAARALLATEHLVVGDTYLFELVGPSNKIVVPYERDELVLLSVYGRDGNELSYPLLLVLADLIGCRVAERRSFSSFIELTEHVTALPATNEGFVVRFEDGSRLKVKGEEYRRVHALISRVTPLAVWEALVAGDDLEAMRRQLPEEFWTDFDSITGSLYQLHGNLFERVAEAAANVSHLSDKELGLLLPTINEDVRGHLFTFRKHRDSLNAKLLRTLRPKDNQLPGYTPSYAMHRVMTEC